MAYTCGLVGAITENRCLSAFSGMNIILLFILFVALLSTTWDFVREVLAANEMLQMKSRTSWIDIGKSFTVIITVGFVFSISGFTARRMEQDKLNDYGDVEEFSEDLSRV